MSSISLFFKDALDYELNHQILIWRLLEDPAFIEGLFGYKISNPKVIWEYMKGTFDLAVSDSEGSSPKLFIELKMWSGLSKSQLEKQTKHIKSYGGNGIYILLGTSNIEYAKNGNRDDIAKRTMNLSQKIGYAELIEGLKKYVANIDNSSDQKDLVREYILALEYQYRDIQNCIYPKDRDKKHKYYYSIYQKIRDLYIKDEINLEIYTENNRGGPSYILNDKSSWFKIEFEGKQFRLFQEILDGIHLIRLMGENSNNSQKRLANIISENLTESELKNYDYYHSMRVSKYMKLARKTLRFDKPNDYRFESSLIIKTHKILKSIAEELQ